MAYITLHSTLQGHPPPPLHSSSTPSLDPRLRERRTPPEMATGLEVQMKLAALAVQSVLFGIYIALVLAMIYLLTLRPHSETVRRTSRLGERLLFAGLILLSAMITGVNPLFSMGLLGSLNPLSNGSASLSAPSRRSYYGKADSMQIVSTRTSRARAKF